jgi:hypothetical protein
MIMAAATIADNAAAVNADLRIDSPEGQVPERIEYNAVRPRRPSADLAWISSRAHVRSKLVVEFFALPTASSTLIRPFSGTSWWARRSVRARVVPELDDFGPVHEKFAPANWLVVRHVSMRVPAKWAFTSQASLPETRQASFSWIWRRRGGLVRSEPGRLHAVRK